MPSAPQILDFGPSPYSRAAEGFGRGFSGQYLQDMQQAEEQSSLDQLIGGLKPGMKEEDVLKHVLAQKGLGFEQKLKATSAINEVLEQTRKRQMQNQLFGGDAQQNQVDSVNTQGDMNKQPPGVIDQPRGTIGDGVQPGVQPQPVRQPRGMQDLSDQQLDSLLGDKEYGPAAKFEKQRRVKDSKQKQPGATFAAEREKAVASYVQDAIEKGNAAEDLKFTIATARKAIQGDISGPGWTAVAKNNPYTQLLMGLTPDEAALQAANKKLLEGSKGIFGSKPTEREIFLLLNSMLPSIGKTKEANLAGLDFIERINDMKLLHSEMVDRLTEGGTKYVPDLERQVSELQKPFAEKMRNDLAQAVQKYGDGTKPVKNDNPGAIRVKAPDGKKYMMTQEQIEAAKAQGVNFEPY